MLRESATIPSRFASRAGGSSTRAAAGSMGGNGGRGTRTSLTAPAGARVGPFEQGTQPPQALVRRPEGRAVIDDAPAQDLHRLDPVVHLGDLHLAPPSARDLLVAQEIVPQSIDDALRSLVQIAQ